MDLLVHALVIGLHFRTLNVSEDNKKKIFNMREREREHECITIFTKRKHSLCTLSLYVDKIENELN